MVAKDFPRGIVRGYNTVDVVIVTGSPASNEIDMREYASGIVVFPLEWTNASLGFRVSNESGGTFVILRDESGSPVQISGVTGSRAYEIPNEVYGGLYAQLWSKSTVTASEDTVYQLGIRTLKVMQKG